MIITPIMMDQKVHEGRNVKRIREILGIKQDALAIDLGLSQQAVSQLEQRESIEPELLERVAKRFGVRPEVIRSFNEEAAINIISSTLHDNAGSINNNCTLSFNPVDKWMETLEENKKLYAALLKEKDERIAALEKIINIKTAG